MNAALPNQVFKSISLDDASASSVRQYVNKQLKNAYAGRLDACHEPLGGRMHDLQLFVRLVLSGEDPEHALRQIVRQALKQLSTFFLNVSATSSDLPWNTAQLWKLIRLLADRDEIELADLVKTPLFALDLDT